MQLSFSHIMKHWKRNPNQVGAPKLPGSRNVLLRFYPPQSALGRYFNYIAIAFSLTFIYFIKKTTRARRRSMNNRKTKRIHSDVRSSFTNSICPSGK